MAVLNRPCNRMPSLRIRIAPAVAAALILLAAGCLASCANAQHERPMPSQDPQVLERGAHLYTMACASCHGANAHGNGPVAPLLKVNVPDLTLIASRRGSAFSDDEIYRIVDGQADLAAHGPRHMPVWGYEFFGEDPDDEVAHREATTKVERLVLYLRSIQRTP